MDAAARVLARLGRCVIPAKAGFQTPPQGGLCFVPPANAQRWRQQIVIPECSCRGSSDLKNTRRKAGFLLPRHFKKPGPHPALRASLSRCAGEGLAADGAALTAGPKDRKSTSLNSSH